MSVEQRTAHSAGAGISAARTVSASPEEVFAFLADLENHWAIADRFVDVVSLEGPPGARHGGLVRMRGPLELRRTARTRVLEAHPSERMVGQAEIGRATSARVQWTLDTHPDGTLVELAATVDRASALDRLLLALGGARWLRRRFAGALDRLAAVVPANLDIAPDGEAA